MPLLYSTLGTVVGLLAVAAAWIYDYGRTKL